MESAFFSMFYLDIRKKPRLKWVLRTYPRMIFKNYYVGRAELSIESSSSR
jgi:hypothetical protein